MSAYLKYALHYNEEYGLAVAFKSVDGRPLHGWREYAEHGMDPATVRSLYREHVEKPGRQALRLAVLTGPYVEGSERHFVVVDVDSPPVAGEGQALELMKAFAREGYQVVRAVRGFHVHAFLPRGESPPYMFTVYTEEGGGRKTVGEGGSLFPHPWSTVPSLRPLGNTWARYSFVLPDGSTVSRFEEYLKRRKELEPPTVSLTGLVEDLSFLLSAKVAFYKAEKVAPTATVQADEGVARRSPVYQSFADFYAALASTPLPTCAAWVLHHYARESGDEFTAWSIASYLQDMFPDIVEKVPRGRRFLVASAAALFLAHVVEWLKFEEVLEAVKPALEGWPADEGATLDRKLAYLFLSSEEGYVYPRYGGLGSLTPLRVWNCADACVFGKMCKGRNPWRPFIRLVKRRELGRSLYEPGAANEM